MREREREHEKEGEREGKRNDCCLVFILSHLFNSIDKERRAEKGKRERERERLSIVNLPRHTWSIEKIRIEQVDR